MPKFETYREMDWGSLKHEFGLDGKRLLPWENYPMPFGAGWCVVRPGTESEHHTQIDQELFVAIKGDATLVIGEEEYPFKIGDCAVIPKHTNHYIRNESEEDFHFYVVWWDEAHVANFTENNNGTTGCLDV